ncbi:MAG: nucleotidyltransferase domain-containing protein [Candidatus Nanohaloarchaea archaeon]
MLSLVNDSRSELAEFFCTYPTGEFSISELAEETGFSKPWISEKVDELEETGFLTVEKRRNLKIARFNRENQESINTKRIINLEQLYSSGLVSKLEEKYMHPETIVLFGSFSRGEDTEKSDIDIAVISFETADIETEVMERPVSIHEFEPGSVPENMKETLANGINLQGYLEIKG